MQGRGQSVLSEVVIHLLVVRVVAVAGIEGLRQQQERTDPVACTNEIIVRRPFVPVLVRMVGQDVLDLVSRAGLPLEIIEPVLTVGLLLDEVSEASQHEEDVAPVALVEAEVGEVRDGFGLGELRRFLVKEPAQRLEVQTAHVSHPAEGL